MHELCNYETQYAAIGLLAIFRLQYSHSVCNQFADEVACVYPMRTSIPKTREIRAATRWVEIIGASTVEFTGAIRDITSVLGLVSGIDSKLVFHGDLLRHFQRIL